LFALLIVAGLLPKMTFEAGLLLSKLPEAGRLMLLNGLFAEFLGT